MKSHALMITLGLGAAPLLTSGELHGLHYRITMQHVLQWEQTVRCLQLDRTQSLAEGFQFGRAAHVVRSPRSLVLEASHIGVTQSQIHASTYLHQ